MPVCSPVSSYYDALAKPVLSRYCEVLHEDADMVRQLDDKYEFSVLAASLGLPVPDAHRICWPGQVEDFDFGTATPPYILKSIPYDPVHRLDLTTLPRPSAAGHRGFRPVQADLAGHSVDHAGPGPRAGSTARTAPSGTGRSRSTAAASRRRSRSTTRWWTSRRSKRGCGGSSAPLKLTGQVSFDFIQADDGRVYAIECNPRTHSAITMFYDHPGPGRRLPGPRRARGRARPPDSRPTYWIYHELWRLITGPDRRARLAVIRRGKDAIFDWDDPLPFLMVHHLQIPWLLLGNLIRGKDWIRIDFNIGKLVEPAGD